MEETIGRDGGGERLVKILPSQKRKKKTERRGTHKIRCRQVVSGAGRRSLGQTMVFDEKSGHVWRCMKKKKILFGKSSQKTIEDRGFPGARRVPIT